MFRFPIRDVLWLTVVVALVVAPKRNNYQPDRPSQSSV